MEFKFDSLLKSTKLTQSLYGNPTHVRMVRDVSEVKSLRWAVGPFGSRTSSPVAWVACGNCATRPVCERAGDFCSVLDDDSTHGCPEGRPISEEGHPMMVSYVVS
jgi:hypothetical protein